MMNVANKVMAAWYQMLNGNISVPVYRVDAPPEERGNYVLLRVESETESSNNHQHVTKPVLITEVVTRDHVRIDDSVAADIDGEISGLLYGPGGPSDIQLPQQDDIQFSEVRRSNATYIQEDDGRYRYYTIATRNVHRVVQLINA